MPAPDKGMMTELAKVYFNSSAISLPVEWSQPNDQYDDAFGDAEKNVAPNAPTNLFGQASTNKYHVDAAKAVGDQFAKYIEGICGAICDGIDNWMKMATIAGPIISGPVGTMTPGNVIGPPLGPLILASAPMATPQEMKYSNAIANTFGTAWQMWQLGLMGTLMYPAFAAFPGPVAPPTPNIPMPLITFSSSGEAGLSASMLKNMMDANLGDPNALHASELFDAISKAFGDVFLIFKSSTMVKNVLGTGPIPSFVPPFVPAGPVLGGVATGAPGCIS